MNKNRPILQNDKYLIAGDFNAKNGAWGENTDDDRGQATLEWIITQRLMIENRANFQPTYECNRGNSWIDITISKNLAQYINKLEK